MTDKAPKWPDDFRNDVEESYHIGKKEKVLIIAFLFFICVAIYEYYELNHSLQTSNFNFDPSVVYDCGTLAKMENMTNVLNGYANATRVLNSINEEQSKEGCK